MSKYIDAEKLKEEIKRLSATEYDGGTFGDDVANGALDYVLEEIIPSLQQEQSNAPKGKFNFPKFLYARTLDNKTIDISYAPQNMEAIEYVRNDFVEQEQSEVDLEKEVDATMKRYLYHITCREEQISFARHFYELGLNARKEKSL